MIERPIIIPALLLILIMAFLAVPVSAGLLVEGGSSITTSYGSTTFNFTIMNTKIPKDGTITIDVSTLDQPAGSSLLDGTNPFSEWYGNFTTANVEVTNNGPATWTATVDPTYSTLTLTSTGADTPVNDYVNVTFIGVKGSPWTVDSFGGDIPLFLIATRTDDSSTAPLNFDIDTVPGTLSVVNGPVISTPSGSTWANFTITGNDIDQGDNISIPLGGLTPVIAGGEPLTNANVQVTNTGLATWTGQISGKTLNLTANTNFAAVGDTVNVTFIGGASGAPHWLDNSDGQQNILLTATRVDSRPDSLNPPNPSVNFNFDINTIPPSNVASTTINGLTITNCNGPQSLSVDTSIVPSAALIPNSSVLQIQPVNSGFKTITFYSRSGFSQNGNLITGAISGVNLVSKEITPVSGFSTGIGPQASFNYSIFLSAYPCAATLSTQIWEGALSGDTNTFFQIVNNNGNKASLIGTAYETKIVKTNFPTPDTVKIHMSVNSSWISSLPGANHIYIGRIPDSGTGSVLNTSFLYYDPVKNLDYFEADSPGGLSTFGLLALGPNNNVFQIITLAIVNQVSYLAPAAQAAPAAPAAAAPAGQSYVGSASSASTQYPQFTPMVTAAPTTPAPPDPGQTAKINSNANGVITQAATLVSTDKRATLILGEGVTAKDSAGHPLSSITIKAIPEGDLPSTSPGTDFSFAGMAYEITPDGATFSPSLALSFVVPLNAPIGEELTIKEYDQATGTWQDLPTQHDPSTGKLTTSISHFCCFAIFAKSTAPAAQSAFLTPAPTANTNAVTPPPPANAMSAFIGMMFWIATLIAQNLIIFAGIVIIAVAVILYARKRRIDRRLGGI